MVAMVGKGGWVGAIWGGERAVGDMGEGKGKCKGAAEGG